MISVNKQAYDIVNSMVARAERLAIDVTHLANGAQVIDLGHHVEGGLLAGKFVANISLGGMGEVNFLPLDFGDFWLPGVSIAVDLPEIGCLASQYAGWGIRQGDFFAIGSGPARALARVEPVFKKIDYADNADKAVLILEGRQPPGAEVAEYIARKCNVEPSNLTLINAPAACLGGSVQLSARVVATGMHKLLYLGFDVRKVLHGFGTCPIAPAGVEEDLASALSNDCVIYGGRVHYTVRADDAEIEAVINRMPSLASPTYGTPFYEIYQRYGSFYNMDPLVFCPSEVTINNLTSGHVFKAGKSHLGVLKSSLLDRLPAK
jgi:methenyltetrahydromethanopterin cyclohydrolase